MDKKEIQEERMRGYFIQATKDLLKGEGLRAVSVRNVADRAGYSYATLYNYFKDVKDLIFECVKDFQDECQTFVRNASRNAPRGIEKIKAISKAYMRFFVQYPGIFELFYLERTSNIAGKKPTVELIYTFLDRLCETEWDYLSENNLLNEEMIGKAKSNLRYSVLGLLLLYISRKHPADYDEFMSTANNLLNNIFSE